MRGTHDVLLAELRRLELPAAARDTLPNHKHARHQVCDDPAFRRASAAERREKKGERTQGGEVLELAKVRLELLPQARIDALHESLELLRARRSASTRYNRRLGGRTSRVTSRLMVTIHTYSCGSDDRFDMACTTATTTTTKAGG